MNGLLAIRKRFQFGSVVLRTTSMPWLISEAYGEALKADVKAMVPSRSANNLVHCWHGSPLHAPIFLLSSVKPTSADLAMRAVRDPNPTPTRGCRTSPRRCRLGLMTIA